MTQNNFRFDCDVVIVNYNAGNLLAKSAQSVLTEGVQGVYIVDNNSHDESLSYLESTIFDDRVHIIRNNVNLGFASACNIGIAASSASTLLFLNPDSVVTSGALHRMLEVSNSNPSIGMVGGLLCNPDGSEQAGGRRALPTPSRAFIRAFGLTYLGKFFPTLVTDFLLHTEPLPPTPIPVEAISGACMLVKRTALENVGLWDEGYFLHCEDLDWCMRFKMNNWLIMFVPDAKITHVLSSCSKSRPFFVEWHKHMGMLRFYRKFFKHQYTDPLWYLVILGVGLRLALVFSYLTVRRIMSLIRVFINKSTHV